MNATSKCNVILLGNKRYVKEVSSFPVRSYLHPEGWTDVLINNELIFSYRDQNYTPDTFTEKFHIHECYQLVFWIQGDVEYFDEDVVFNSEPHMVMWFKPGHMHNAKLRKPCRCKRYVFHFSEEFFKLGDTIVPMLDFINHSAGTHMILSEETFHEILEIFQKAKRIIQEQKPYCELILKALMVEVFYILNSNETRIKKGESVTGVMGDVKRYIDINYATISSISEVAEQFFYSREHLSRKFKETFNMSVANYLTRRKIAESLPMLEKMGVTEVAYAVGYHSQSAFIDAFKKQMHCLPSEYKSRCK